MIKEPKDPTVTSWLKKHQLETTKVSKVITGVPDEFDPQFFLSDLDAYVGADLYFHKDQEEKLVQLLKLLEELVGPQVDMAHLRLVKESR